MTRVPTNASTIASQIASIVGDTTFNSSGWRQLFSSDFRDRFGIFHPDNPVKDGARGNVTSSNARRTSIFHSGFTRTTGSDIVWLELDGTFVGIRSIRGKAPVTGTNVVYDSANAGQLAGLVMELGAVEEYADLAAFPSAILSSTSLDLDGRDNATPRISYTALNGDVIDVTFSTSGQWVEPDFDWNYGVTEQRVGFNTTDWIQPTWPTGEGHGRTPVRRCSGKVAK